MTTPLSKDAEILLALNEGAWAAELGWAVAKELSQWEGVTVVDGRVTELRLGEKGLAGSIPNELGQLQSLEKLDLSWNKFEGSIPPELGQLQKLERLYLNINRLTGSIPKELGQLEKLESLYLSENKLEGSIPPELGDLKNLQVLNLSENLLTGTVPKELGRLRKLSTVELAANKLGTFCNGFLRHAALYDEDAQSLPRIRDEYVLQDYEYGVALNVPGRALPSRKVHISMELAVGSSPERESFEDGNGKALSMPALYTGIFGPLVHVTATFEDGKPATLEAPGASLALPAPPGVNGRALCVYTCPTDDSLGWRQMHPSEYEVHGGQARASIHLRELKSFSWFCVRVHNVWHFILGGTIFRLPYSLMVLRCADVEGGEANKAIVISLQGEAQALRDNGRYGREKKWLFLEEKSMSLQYSPRFAIAADYPITVLGSPLDKPFVRPWWQTRENDGRRIDDILDGLGNGNHQAILRLRNAGHRFDRAGTSAEVQCRCAASQLVLLIPAVVVAIYGVIATWLSGVLGKAGNIANASVVFVIGCGLLWHVLKSDSYILRLRYV